MEQRDHILLINIVKLTTVRPTNSCGDGITALDCPRIHLIKLALKVLLRTLRNVYVIHLC